MGLELLVVSKRIGIGVCAGDVAEDDHHVFGNRSIEAPQVRKVESSALTRVPPRQQKVGYSHLMDENATES